MTHASTLADLQEQLLSRWAPVTLEAHVLQSQQERLLIEQAAKE